MSAPRSSYAQAGLAACCVGLALSPLAYIATGALGGFAPVFSMITLPPLAAALGLLLYRLLGRPRPADSGPVGAVAEGLSWLVVVAFLVLVSGFTLMTPFERVGQTLSYFLTCTVLSVPLILWRPTEAARRTSGLGEATASLVLFGLLAVCGAVALLYLVQPPAFP